MVMIIFPFQKKTSKYKEFMKKTAIEVYALIICLGAMACLAVNTGLVIYNVVSLVKPDLAISNYQYTNHQSNDNYWQHQFDRLNSMQISDFTLKSKEGKKRIQRPIESELTKQRINSYQNVINAEKRSATRDLIFESIIILVSVILVFTHWHFVLHRKQGIKQK